MPLYTYECPVEGCTHTEDHLAKIDDRDVPPGCCPQHPDTFLLRQSITTPVLDFTGNVAGRFQMRAVTTSGEKVAGHFGRTARKR